MLKYFNIVQKIWLTIGLLIVCYCATMILLFISGIKTGKRLSDVSDYVFPATSKSQLILSSFKEQIKLYTDAVVIGDGELVALAQEKWRESDGYLKEMLMLSGLSKSDLDGVKETRRRLADFSRIAGDIYLIMSSSTEGYDAQRSAELVSKTDEIKRYLTLFQEKFANDLRHQLLSVKQATNSNSLINMLVFFGVVIFAVVFNTLLISRSIRRPLRYFIDMVKDIAEGEGDLTKRLQVQNDDELGELARWFNRFIDKLQEMIKDTANTAVILSDSSQELSDLSSVMTESANQMSIQSNIVSVSSKEMKVNMDNVAISMEQASENTEMVATSVEEMTSTINEIAQNASKAANVTNEAVTQTGTVSARVGELGAAAREIGQVTETITDISSQTNLLALNATIEAARAGDTGKGFAVVADEIKELASQTGQATRDIKNRVDGIQQSASGTVAAIKQITDIITVVNDLVNAIATAVEEQSVATNEIAGNVVQTSKGIVAVSDNVSNSSIVAGKISEDISDVNRSTEEMTKSSSHVHSSAEKLSMLAVTLKEMMGRFKING